MGKNKIFSIEDFSLNFLDSDFSLDLFGNKNISKISSDSLSNVFYSHFSYESVFLLKNYHYSWFKTEILDLSKSGIIMLNENTIKGTFSNLILSNNLISSFEPNSFGVLPNLTEISFRKNLIKKLDFYFK